MTQPAMPSIGWLKHAFGRQRRLSLNPLHPSVKVSTAFLGHGGRLKRPFFASVAIITTGRNRNFASQDKYFLENWSCSGLRSRPGFIVAGSVDRYLLTEYGPSAADR